MSLQQCVLARLLVIVFPILAWAQTFPGKDWAKADKPESAGFSTRRLVALTPLLQTLDTSAMMVVSKGQVVFEYGDLSSGKIALHTTLRVLKMDDVGGLLPRELDATVENLITARSGVFHPASYPGDARDSAPPRGSQKPGTYYLYNNWDFNAAGAVFEKLTGRDIYDALETDLARPIGMQDFDRTLQKKEGDSKVSIYPAYPMHLSTRDMARIGYLMLREGNWNGRQLVPKDWVHRIVSLVTPMYDMNPPSWREYAQGSLWGYGYMWWVWDDHHRDGPFAGAYSARGALGQFITVFPALDVVVAHKTVPRASDKERTREVSGMEYQAILIHVAAAYCGSNCIQ
jgi:hypothetical protein